MESKQSNRNKKLSNKQLRIKKKMEEAIELNGKVEQPVIELNKKIPKKRRKYHHHYLTQKQENQKKRIEEAILQGEAIRKQLQLESINY